MTEGQFTLADGRTVAFADLETPARRLLCGATAGPAAGWNPASWRGQPRRPDCGSLVLTVRDTADPRHNRAGTSGAGFPKRWPSSITWESAGL